MFGDVLCVGSHTVVSTTAAQARPWTVEDFLTWEREQPDTHEFIDGRIYALTSPRVGHGRRVNRIAGAIREQVPQGCEVFTEAYLLVAAGDASRPDVIVACDAPADDATEFRDAKLLVKVLSPSNRPGEMEKKVEAYLTLPSLKAYLVVDGEAYETWTRIGEDGPWQQATLKAGEFAVMVHGREVRF